jgi:hypothetical protein
MKSGRAGKDWDRISRQRNGKERTVQSFFTFSHNEILGNNPPKCRVKLYQ